MTNVVVAAAIVGGLGLFFGTLLAVASRLLRVDEDPRIEMVVGLLPGSNCGACGEPGCRGFAEVIVSGDRKPSGCTVASGETIESIAEALGIDAGQQEKRVARLHCAGGRSVAKQVAAYEGYESCRGAALVAGGGKGCAWGCLGLGDCERACTFDAIAMSDEGLPLVDLQRCTACGDCVVACPRDLFDIAPVTHKLVVQCSAPLAADQARELCQVACDACGRCAQDAASGLISMVDNLPIVDYSGGGPAEQRAVLRCPTGAIQWVEGEQLPHLRPRAGEARV